MKKLDDRLEKLEHKAIREERDRIDDPEWREDHCDEIRWNMLINQLKSPGWPGVSELLDRIENLQTEEDGVILQIIEELSNYADDCWLLDIEIQHECVKLDIPLNLPVSLQVARIDATRGSKAWRQICKQPEQQRAVERCLGINNEDFLDSII
jgi:hypothetical protein